MTGWRRGEVEEGPPPGTTTTTRTTTTTGSEPIMATVTIFYENGDESSFTTYDKEIMRRYENKALTDDEIKRVAVTE